MKKTNTNTNSSQLRLPNEIVDDILLCLPAKSLKRFKLVSKPWNSLISDPNFAESHLNRSLRPNTDNCNLLRVGKLHVKSLKLTPSNNLHPLSFYSMDSDGSNREVVLIPDFDYDDKDFMYNCEAARILGSCNGLLLLSYETYNYPNCNLLLWNPSTGKCKRIPGVNIPDRTETCVISGLVYVSSSRNYKAIVVYHQVSGYASPNHGYATYEALDCNIYDYNLNSWTTKDYDHDAFPYRLHSDSSAIMVNGVPHWGVYVYRRRGHRSKPLVMSYLIVYFNSETEKFKEVELPEWKAEEATFNIGVLGGCLCMCLDPQKGSRNIEVWTMKEYGIAESWTKSFVISSPSFQRLTPLCLMGKNQVLMKVEMKKLEEQLVIYNLKEKTRRILLVDRIHKSLMCRVCTYVGSLVFPEEAPEGTSHRTKRKRKG
ncbi:hypothetical protein COLO4_03306 [Corchorus olitorius]|uniref:F-box domain-containing protein n=1 Tax=Corchorus olitorius TaxID=93759 RepID=A0A1R3KZ05_9ROSI|nr:hypothetical protein COLO4_03306 [Corchorus olitorius]